MSGAIPAEPCGVWCDGRRLEITKNLHNALARFREREETCLLWADGICINQDDAEEKSSQVSAMSRIYSLAKRVLVWLGPEMDGSDAAVGFLKDLTRRSCEMLPTSDPEDLLKITSYEFGPSVEELPPASHEIWAPVVSLFGRPYFNRVWVIQEVFAAKEALAFVGGSQLKWAELVIGIRWIIHRSMEKHSVLIWPRFEGKGTIMPAS